MFIIIITENRVTGVDVNPCTGTIMALKHKNTWYMFDACFPLTEKIYKSVLTLLSENSSSHGFLPLIFSADERSVICFSFVTQPR